MLQSEENDREKKWLEVGFDCIPKKSEKKNLSEVGFEPTPTYVDQKTPTHTVSQGLILESGALDHSATLTAA